MDMMWGEDGAGECTLMLLISTKVCPPEYMMELLTISKLTALLSKLFEKNLEIVRFAA